MNNELYNSNTCTLKSETNEPRCKELLDLWFRKSKNNIYAISNAEFKGLLEKDPLTQKIVQSLQTIRSLWESEYPGDDDNRQEEYEEGAGYYFKQWMFDYNEALTTMIYYKTISPFWDMGAFKRIAYTNETKKICKVLKEATLDKIDILKDEYEEVLIMLKAADTYQHEIEILQAYGIVDILNGRLTIGTEKFETKNLKSKKE